MLFVALAGCIAIVFYVVYRFFNEKIKGSSTLLILLLYTLLLILCDAGILLLGIWGLLKIYEQLS